MTVSDTLRCVGRNIRDARLRAGLTQECLAELVGVHWKTIGNIERGVYPFAITHFVAIVQHLGVEAGSLLEGLNPPDAKRIHAVRKALARKRKPKADYLARTTKPARG
ncbi:MAG TPA: helix-turn-helix transcriptional regulator [Verrucomicrobiae bacterium]